jgi:hypothetical protein
MKNLLINHYGYDQGNILVLEDTTTYKPIGENIFAAWEWLLSGNPASHFLTDSVKLPLPDASTLVFHYSGHGCRANFSPDKGSGILRKCKQDDAICPLDFQTNGMIIDDDIRNRLAFLVPASCKLSIFLDACHSGNAVELSYICNYDGTTFSLSPQGKYTDVVGNVVCFAGCKDNQTSADVRISNVGHGAFTYTFMKVLADAKYNITYNTLMSDILASLRSSALSDQIPVFTVGHNLDICIPFSL